MDPITILVSIFASAIVSTGGTPVIDHVIDSNGDLHTSCVDVGPTICVDGAIFSDEQGPTNPTVNYRSDVTYGPYPATVPCDTDADCEAKNPGLRGYGN